MKNFFLAFFITIASAFAFSSLAAETDDYILLGYCGEYAGATGNYGNFKAAIEIPESTAQQYAGSQLTEIRIGFGVASKNEITVYISESMRGEAIYSQAATITNQDGWNEVVLDTPFDIDGSGFFIGYIFNGATAQDHIMGFDGIPTSNRYGDYVCYNGSWMHMGNQYGNLCIKGVIKGEGLPRNNVDVGDLTVPFSVAPNESFSISTDVVNQGANLITEVNVECFINGKKFENPEYSLSSGSLAPGDHAVLTVKGLSSNVEAADLNVELTVSEVNGVPNESTENSTSSSTSCFSMGFPRKMVVEEWTGTWCGNCPRGIVGMDHMSEKYPDSFIGIAVHGNDPMESASYSPILNSLAFAYPGCIVNRKYQCDPSINNLEDYYERIGRISSNGSCVGVQELSGAFDPDNAGVLSVSATLNFAAPVVNGGFSLAFVITEDQVGPYNQVNFYAGASYDAWGWEKKLYNQPWNFDHVARDIKGVWGIQGSIPASLEANTPYIYNTTFPLAHVKNLRRCNLVALVLNDATGEIVNAGSVSLRAASVENVSEGAGFSIRGGHGEIAVDGEYHTCRIFTLGGGLVAIGNGRNKIPVAPGMYVVEVDGHVGKVVVK